MIRIAIADDHRMVLEGLTRILADQDDLQVVAQTDDGHALFNILSETDVDVLVLDIAMPGPGFLPIMARISVTHPNLAVLIVSIHTEYHWVVQALKAGAAGYLPKTQTAEALADAIRRVSQGGRYITPATAEYLAGQLGPNPKEASLASLSPREYQTLLKLGSGKMVKTVAREMGISPKTVSTYRARILEKLNLRSTADIIRFAIDSELVA